MPTDNGANAVRELKDIGNTLNKLVKAVEAGTKVPTARFSNLPIPDILAEVPACLDWAVPQINGQAKIVRLGNQVTITIVLNKNDTDRVIDLVKQLEMGCLQVSAMGE